MITNVQRLLFLQELFNLPDFVETGTQGGHTFREVEPYFKRAFTIELDGPPPPLVERYAGSNRISLIKGKSGEVLAQVLEKNKIALALFWLDAHGNQTYFKDDGLNQIPQEFEAIEKWAPNSLVVVDDITHEKGKVWVNCSYEFKVPRGWTVRYIGRLAILHRGGYVLGEKI